MSAERFWIAGEGALRPGDKFPASESQGLEGHWVDGKLYTLSLPMALKALGGRYRRAVAENRVFVWYVRNSSLLFTHARVCVQDTRGYPMKKVDFTFHDATKDGQGHG